MDKTLLITGATGFLGSHLTKKFVDENYKVVILKRIRSDPWRIKDVLDNICCYNIDKTGIETPFQENKIDIIIHAAVNYGRDGIVKTVETNINFPLMLLETAIRYDADVFINTDTFYTPCYDLYSLSKKQLLEWFKYFQADIRIFNLKLEHIHGEMDSVSKFIPFIIKELLRMPTEIRLTKGIQKRDFIYVNDVVNAYKQVIVKSHKLEKRFYEYELGLGKSISIKDVVMLIKKMTGNNQTFLNFGALPHRENEIMDSKANLYKIIQDISWQPSHSLEKGLRRTINWYRDNLK